MVYYLKLHKNWQTVLTLSSSHVVVTLASPNYQPSTLDIFCITLIGHTTFPSFPHPTSQQWHWSPHNVDIYNSQIHGSWFMEHIISYHFVMSKSCIFGMFSAYNLHQWILFYSFQLIMIQFSICVQFFSVYNPVLWRLIVALEIVIDRLIDTPCQENYALWIFMNYIICKAYTVMPHLKTHFSILFNAVKLLLVHLYSHAHVFSRVSFVLLHLLYL